MSCDAGDILIEGNSFAVLARWTGLDGAAVTQSSIASGTYTVVQIATDGSATKASPVTMTIASVFFNTLATTHGWTRDETGWNFRLIVPGSSVTAETGTLRIQFDLIDSSASANPIKGYVERALAKMY